MSIRGSFMVLRPLARTGHSISTRTSISELQRQNTLIKAGLLRRRYTTSLNHPSTVPNRGSAVSHLAAGLAGGIVVVAAAYGYYHFSGLKSKVDAAKSVRTFVTATAQSIGAQFKGATSTTQSNRAVASLRAFTKSSVAAIPGAGLLVDIAFDSVDKVVDEHSDEATQIAHGAYADIFAAVSKRPAGQTDLETSGKVMAIMRAKLGELHALGIKAGTSHLAGVAENHPQVAEALGERYVGLIQLAKSKEMEVRKTLGDAKQTVDDVLKHLPVPVKDARERMEAIFGKDKKD